MFNGQDRKADVCFDLSVKRLTLGSSFDRISFHWAFNASVPVERFRASQLFGFDWTNLQL